MNFLHSSGRCIGKIEVSIAILNFSSFEYTIWVEKNRHSTSKSRNCLSYTSMRVCLSGFLCLPTHVQAPVHAPLTKQNITPHAQCIGAMLVFVQPLDFLCWTADEIITNIYPIVDEEKCAPFHYYQRCCYIVDTIVFHIQGITIWDGFHLASTSSA